MKRPPLVLLMLLAAMPACRTKSAPETSETQATASATTSAKPTANAPAEDQIPAPADVAAPPATAEKTASGLASIVLKPPTGTDKPRPQDKVKVNYTGWTKDGKMFDSS